MIAVFVGVFVVFLQEKLSIYSQKSHNLNNINIIKCILTQQAGIKCGWINLQAPKINQDELTEPVRKVTITHRL